MGRIHDPDDVELLSDLEQMAEAAEMEDGEDEAQVDEEEFDWPENTEVGGNPDFLRPMRTRKVWIVIALIFFAIAVAVLYVYQAGDPKTILGNQPIPAGQSAAGAGGATTAAMNNPMGGHLHRAPARLGGGGAPLAAQCPVCGDLALPMCSKCNTVMQPLDQAPGLYVCPSCGVVGSPICPHCGGQMTSQAGCGIQPAGQPGTNTRLAAAPG